MKIWTRLGSAGLAAAALAFGATQAGAACINDLTNQVDNPAHCLFADGGDNDCRVAISVDGDGAGNPPAEPKKIECEDGAACDQDGGVNGSCTFHVGACVNLTGCSAATVTAGTVNKPSQKDADSAFKRPNAADNRNELQDALDAILPASGQACTDSNLDIKVELKKKAAGCAISEEKCASDLDCMETPGDYCTASVKKNKTNVDLFLDDGAGGAKAKFKLTCLPATTFAPRAFQIANASDLIGGPLAMGRVGDYAIRNGNLRAVARGIGRQHSFTLLHGGQIMDADLTRDDPSEDRDSWQGIAPLVHISNTQATDNIVVDDNGTTGGAAIIHSSGPDDLFDTIKGDVLVAAAGPLSVPADAIDVDLDVEVHTRLILPPYSNSIQIATTVDNPGGSDLNLYMGDFINPGGQLEPFGPGQGYGETQLRNGATTASGGIFSSSSNGQPLNFLAFQGRMDAEGVTYGVIFPPTNLSTRRTLNTGVFSSSGVYAWVTNHNLFDTLFQSLSTKPPGSFQVDAGGENTLRRWFVVGDDIADVSKAHLELVGGEKAALQGYVRSGGAPVAGAHVTLFNDDANWAGGTHCLSDNCLNILSSALTDEHGFYRFTVAPGGYQIAVRKSGSPYEGGAGTPVVSNVTLEDKGTTIKSFDIPSTGTIVVNVEDQAGAPIAAKVSVVGVPASPDPTNDEFLPLGLQQFTGRYFGFDFEEKGDNFGLASYQFAGTDGTTGEFNLEPGTYNVVVSHGYEYDVYKEQITVTAGATTTVDATVNQVVDTTGFVSIDAHVHAIFSPDSTISFERRILSMIAEGVDFFANTDHDFAHSLSDEIAGMGATSLIANAPSSETTTSHYGHFNTWPVTVDSGQHAGGAVDWSFDLTDVNGEGFPSDGAFDNSPNEIFAKGAAYPGTQVIQINHFNSGTLGHFNMLGIDTELNPPVSSNDVWRCVGGSDAPASGYGKSCHPRKCLGGTNDGGICTSIAECPGVGASCSSAVTCGGGGTCTAVTTLAELLRLDPVNDVNLYGDNFTALEVWIEAGRGQTNVLRSENMGDWFNLMNQGRFKAGVADSDTHSLISVQSGGPRTFVASSTDAPGSIDPEELATNVNGLRAFGSNGPFVRIELENGSAETASQELGSPRHVTYTGGGADSVNLHIEAPTWAEFDTIELYMNSVPSCKSEWTFFGARNPSSCSTVTATMTLTKGVDFTVSTTTGVSGSGQRQVADVEIPVTISADTWVVAVVRGTDGISKPLFPMQPQDIEQAGNDTLAALTDNNGALPWNLGEDGVLALAFTNPLFFDNGDNVCHGGTACPN